MADRPWPRALALTVAAALALAACGGDDTSSPTTTAATFVALDGSARRPSEAGVLTGLDEEFAFLVLDGDLTIDLSPDLQSFASMDGSSHPLRSRVGQYVQVGIKDDKVVWVAGLGAVVQLPDQPNHVIYIGKIIEVGGTTMVLQDGTVLELADGIAIEGEPSPESPIAAVLTIDVASDQVVEVVPT